MHTSYSTRVCPLRFFALVLAFLLNVPAWSCSLFVSTCAYASCRRHPRCLDPALSAREAAAQINGVNFSVAWNVSGPADRGAHARAAAQIPARRTSAGNTSSTMPQNASSSSSATSTAHTAPLAPSHQAPPAPRHPSQRLDEHKSVKKEVWRVLRCDVASGAPFVAHLSVFIGGLPYQGADEELGKERGARRGWVGGKGEESD